MQLPKRIQHIDEHIKTLESTYVSIIDSRKHTGHKRARQKQYAKRLRKAISVKKQRRCSMVAEWIVQTALVNNVGISIEQLRWVQGGLWDRATLREEILWRAERHGIPVVEVFAKNTSQICYLCSGFVTHNNTTRKARCKTCGNEEDRDVNASHNIAKRGQKSKKININPVTMKKMKCFIKAKKSAPRSGVPLNSGESETLIYDTLQKVGNDPTSLKNIDYHTIHM